MSNTDDAGEAPPVPGRLDLFPNGEIGIVWKDGHESCYSGRDLRLQCPCAGCVDEHTGRRILDEAAVPRDIQARMLQGVGSYGVQVVWSTGHATGIYSHRLLRKLCPCEACRT